MSVEKCVLCGYLSDGSPYRRLFKLNNKKLCRNCAIKTYGYEETLNRLSQTEGFICDFCHEKRVIGFNTPPSNKIIDGKTKCGICYYGSKSMECCGILSIFASHAKINIDSKKEEFWFNDFACRFFQVLEKHDKLCLKCLDFYKRLKKELEEKTVIMGERRREK